MTTLTCMAAYPEKVGVKEPVASGASSGSDFEPFSDFGWFRLSCHPMTQKSEIFFLCASSRVYRRSDCRKMTESHKADSGKNTMLRVSDNAIYRPMRRA